MDNRLMLEAGKVAACTFLAVLIVWLFGGNDFLLWKVVGWCFVLNALTYLLLRINRF